MPNKIYRARIISEIDRAIREAENATKTEHPGLVGYIRELSASHVFGPLLPSGFKIGKGKICDREGRQSRETDLIIHNSSILPPIMYNERLGVFPIEACFYSIEVKSKATASEIRDAIQKGREILSLDYPKPADEPKNVSLVVLAFLAFGSDLSDSGMSELQRYAKYDPEWREDPVLRAMCVVGKGYWYYRRHDSCWISHAATKEHDEVIDFVSGMVNTLAETRRHERLAHLGKYLMLERPSKQRPDMKGRQA